MAQILLFQGTDEHFTPLRNSLQDYHKLYFVHNITDGMEVLHEMEIDLIIWNVYDDTTDAFAFLTTVKEDPISSGTPCPLFRRSERY